MDDGVILAESGDFRLTRTGRFVAARLLRPHRVLSTSQVNGGEQERLGYLLNHQSCEGKGHMGRHHDLAVADREAYHRATCAEAGLPPDGTALMGTAANMQNAAVAKRTFGDVSVWAAVTAGVQGNAGRAGDEAKWHEGEAGWRSVHALGGTINTLVLFDAPLLPGALARAVATLTEAKTAVLHELAVPSRSSPHLATGTGTDQFCLAAPLDPARRPKTWTGKHGKLGEILALAVMEATREALRWQNGLEPSRTRHLGHILGRFGVEEEGLLAALEEGLSRSDHGIVSGNFNALLHEPQVAAAAHALAAVMDRAAFGALPPAAAAEALLNQAALMAAALSAKPAGFPAYRTALASGSAAHATLAAAASAEGKRPDLLPLVAAALALGWSAKWT